jgi:hypothetical protein
LGIEKDTTIGKKLFDQMKTSYLKGWTARLIGEALSCINGSEMNNASEWFRTSIEWDMKHEHTFFLAQDYAAYARFLGKEDSAQMAKENMTKAIQIMKDCGADGWVVRYEKELTEFDDRG